MPNSPQFSGDVLPQRAIATQQVSFETTLSIRDPYRESGKNLKSQFSHGTVVNRANQTLIAMIAF